MIIAGATTLNTSAANAAITLTTAGNTFGAITVSSGSGNVSITEAATMDIASVANTGNVTLNAGANQFNLSGTIGTFSANTVANPYTGTVALTATGTNDVVLSSASSIYAKDITVNAGKDVQALGSITGAEVNGTITLNANAATGSILGSNDNSKLLNAHAISLTAHAIGDPADNTNTLKRVKTNLNTNTPNSTMLLALNLGQITSTSKVNIDNSGATLEFKEAETGGTNTTQD